MTDRIRIPVSLLKEASDLLLRHLESVEGPDVLLDSDYYWSIRPEQMYNAYVEPTEFTIGQISECAENIQNIVAEPTLATSFGLVWLAEILRAAGQSVVR